MNVTVYYYNISVHITDILQNAESVLWQGSKHYICKKQLNNEGYRVV